MSMSLLRLALSSRHCRIWRKPSPVFGSPSCRVVSWYRTFTKKVKITLVNIFSQSILGQFLVYYLGTFWQKLCLLLKLIFSATWRSALLKWCHRGNWSLRIVWTFWSFWWGGRLLLSRRLLLLFSASLRNWSRHDLKLLKNVTLFLGRRHLLIRSDEVRNGLRSWYSCDVPVRPGGVEQVWPIANIFFDYTIQNMGLFLR